MTETIRIELLRRGLTMEDLAQECGWSRQYLYKVMQNGKPKGAVAKIKAAAKQLIEGA